MDANKLAAWLALPLTTAAERRACQRALADVVRGHEDEEAPEAMLAKIRALIRADA